MKRKLRKRSIFLKMEKERDLRSRKEFEIPSRVAIGSWRRRTFEGSRDFVPSSTTRPSDRDIANSILEMIDALHLRFHG